MGLFYRQTGSLGERAAANFLRDRGYEIIAVNYRTRFGEIDIIATYLDYIVFVEVKTRDENSIAQPREFVVKSKQQKIIKTALMYIQYSDIDLQPRFDVIEVYTGQMGKTKDIIHLENAFDGSDL